MQSRIKLLSKHSRGQQKPSKRSKVSRTSSVSKTPSTMTSISTGPREHENYQAKMLRLYKNELKDAKGFAKAKAEAEQQRENWLRHKIEQAVEIFKPETQYVSKTAKLDESHPLAKNRNKVKDKEGRDVKITFGKLQENLLSIYPNRRFIHIPELAEREKERKGAERDYLQRHKIGAAVEKKKERNKKRHNHFFDLSAHPDGGDVDLLRKPQSTREPETSEQESRKKSDSVSVKHTKTSGPEKGAAAKPKKTEDEINTTDELKTVFKKTWYVKENKALNVAMSNKEKKHEAYWLDMEDSATANEDDEFAVTTETIEEVMTGEAQVARPTEYQSAANSDGFAPLSRIVFGAKKFLEREYVYQNTVWSTIDFSNAVKGQQMETKGFATKQSPSTKVKWNKEVDVTVFKGTRIRRDRATLVARTQTSRTEKLQDIIKE